MTYPQWLFNVFLLVKSYTSSVPGGHPENCRVPGSCLETPQSRRPVLAPRDEPKTRFVRPLDRVNSLRVRLLLQHLDWPVLALHHVNPHMVIHTARRQEHPSRAKGCADHLSSSWSHLLVIARGIRVEHCAFLSFGDLVHLVAPKTDRAITRGGGQIVGDSGSSAGTEVERGDGAGVLGQHGDGGGGLQTPHPDDLVSGAGGQQPVVLGHGHVRDLGRGAAEGEIKPPVAGAPHLDQQVVGAGEDIAAGLVEEEAEDWREVAQCSAL